MSTTMLVLGLGLVLFSVAFYFLPTLIAAIRGKRNSFAILALNLFLGWTLVGWVVSLVWALTVEEDRSAIVVQNFQQPSATASALPKATLPARLADVGPANQKPALNVLAIVGLISIVVMLGIVEMHSFGSRGSGANANAPTATVTPDPPAHIVAAFYRAINRKDFATAWDLLSPTFQRDGSFDKFKDGYATTRSVSASVAEVPGVPQKVRVSLDATDLIGGDTVHTRFEGWWVLTQASDGHWLLENGHFTKTQTDAATSTGSPTALPTSDTAMPTDSAEPNDSPEPERTPEPEKTTLAAFARYMA